MINSNLVKVQFPLLLLLLICISSCCEQPKTISDRYFEGYVINRAEDDYPIGLIRFKDIFEGEEELESPARAIIYHATEDNEKVDLHDLVFFKIYGNGKNQIAGDVKKSLSVTELTDKASQADLYILLESISFNLHNSDMHREGPKHTRRHIKSVIGGEIRAMDNTNTMEYFKIIAEKEGTVETDTFYISIDDLNIAGSDYFFFEETNIYLNLPPENSIPVTATRLSTTHDHTF